MEFGKWVVDNASDATGWRVLRERTPSPAPGQHILDIAIYTQLNTYCCGVAAGFSVVKTFYPDAELGHFYDLVNPDPEFGTPTRALRRALRQSGVWVRSPRLTYEALISQIRAGHPVIVIIRNPGADNLHYVVAYGCGHGRILLGSNGIPWVHRKWYDREVFTSMWEPRGNALVCWAERPKTSRKRLLRLNPRRQGRSK